MLKARALTYKLNEKKLIQDISLDFYPGILYGILGPNGSGKTTLCKNLSGIWKPTNGQVLWHDENLLSKDRQEISRIISLVPQNPTIQFDFSVWDFVYMGRYPHHLNKKEQKDEIVEWALRTVRLLEFKNRPITNLSAGENKGHTLPVL